ncbi:hypothetical protein ACS0TY_012429 [Phlomoides rotata]
MSDNRFLRKVASDITNEKSKVGDDDLESFVELDETIILEVECDCCGLKEDCTKDYISRIRNLYSGKWVCGLCSEAVNELRLTHDLVAMEEAMSTHTNFVQETRINPKLSLTWTMRDIAKRSGDKRKINSSGGMKIMRSSSCFPRIN